MVTAPGHSPGHPEGLGPTCAVPVTTAVCNAKIVRITTKTVADFRVVQRYLQNERLEFHTFTLTSERPLQVVIRGLTSTVEAIEVHDYLVDRGFHVTEAKQLRNGKGITGLWLVSLSKDSTKPADEIFNLSSMFFSGVTVRKYNRSTAPIQCHRCQGLGHASFGCGRSPKCVKCGGPLGKPRPALTTANAPTVGEPH